MKNITFKIFVWVIEFELKKRQDDKRILFLVERLKKELISQGIDVSGSRVETFISIFEHDKEWHVDTASVNTVIKKEETI